MPSLSRITAAAIFVWLGFLFYASTILVRIHQSNVAPPETSDNNDLLQRLTKALQDVEDLKEHNEKLKTWLNTKVLHDEIKIKKDSGSDLSLVASNNVSNVNSHQQSVGHYSRNHEDLRRSVTNNIVEFWYSLNGKLKTLKESISASSDGFDQMLISLEEQYRTVLGDALKLADVDNAGDWRRNQLKNLTIVVQKRLDYLQNPRDCKTARKLVCNLNKGCGFGCQIHHASYCFIMAYATNRTLILNAHGWRYSQRGWDSVFLPLSRTCLEGSEADAQGWKGFDDQQNVQMVSVPIIDSLRPRIPQLPLSFPKDLSEKLLLLHSNPPVWWVAQFVWYLMRYQPDLQNDLHSAAQKLKFKGPIVGLHVRRTDKVGSEAAFHSIEEYMKHADDWFNLQMMKNDTTDVIKRVYLATDEPSLIDETRRKYPNYQVLADASIAASAQLNNRYSDSSLRGVIADVHFLARCDYLVCTFSSQVCRIAYELMQIVKNDDLGQSYKSLDDIYYFGGQEGHEQIAVLEHTPAKGKSDELELKIGDILGIAGNHWDGYSKGRNSRTGHTGLYPSYKAKEKWRIVDFPVYPVDNARG